MELYDSKLMPLSGNSELRKIQEGFTSGEKKVNLFGRDRLRIKKNLGDYQCKSNYCYRAITPEVYELYKKNGVISDYRPNTKEYEEYIDEKGQTYNNNAGIDWYLGGAAPGSRYGNIIIECPADKVFFKPARDNGCGMTIDPTVRHMKSSPKNNPIPISMITNVFDYSKIQEQEKAQFDVLRQKEMQNRQELREQQLISTNQTNLIDEGNLEKAR